MERTPKESPPIPFRCECGAVIQVTPDSRHYVCSGCPTRYFIIYTPFDIFTRREKFLLNKRDPRMNYICTEVAARRLLSTNKYLDVSSITIAWLRSHGCQGIHTISKCLNDVMKYVESKGEFYQLMYRRPITTQVAIQGGKMQSMHQAFTLAQEYPIIKQYLTKTLEPLLLSVIPLPNWQHLMDSFYKTEKTFSELYRMALHSVLVTGYTEETQRGKPKLLLHNHLSNVPIAQQKPYSLTSLDSFIYEHTLADFRTIFNFHLLPSELEKTILKYYQPTPKK